MNRKQWGDFLLKAFGQVMFEGQTYIDLQLISKADFPALYLLEELSIKELMILSWLIQMDTNCEQENTWVPIDDVTELFQSYDCSSDDLISAMCDLSNRGFAYLKALDNGICICTLTENLREKGIITSDYDSIFYASSEDKNELYSPSLLN